MNKIQTFVFILSIFLSIEAIHAQINNNMDKSIIISTSEDLYQLACKVNQGNSFDGVHIKLANDLLLNDTTGWQQWKKGNSRLRPWTPIGNAQSPFRGDFDGQGHTIYGIYMNESSNNQIYQGLFGFLEDGSISHVHIRSSFFIGHNFVGAICGYIKGTYLKGIAQIDHCNNNSSVESSRNHAGGIVGFSEGCNRIINCSNNGMVKAKRCAGGIAGYFQDGTIINCYNRGRIHILYESAGGIIGEYYENPYRGFTESDTIANCYNTGIVSGRDVVGGIIGNLQLYSKEFVPQKIHIDNCYNAGMLKSTYPVTTDGLIGCYTYYQTEQEVFSSLKLNRGSLKKQLKNMIPQIVYGLNPRNSLTTKEDNDLNDPAHIHRGTGTVRRIERYSAKSYWSDLCCSPVNLTQPRFNTYKIAEEYWSELMRYSQHCKQFERCEDASMKAHAFVKRLNKWVKEEEKKLKKKKRQTSLYLEWQTDAEKINEGYPIFIESEKN